MEITGYRALVVDDEAYIRELTSRSLASRSLPCDTAADGDQGLLLAKRNQYDVVITDLRMPNRNGHSLATELLTWPNRPRVIVLTGLVAPQLCEDLIRRGVDDVLQKPIDTDAFAKSVLYQIDPALVEEDTNDGNPANSTTAKIEQTLLELTEMFAERLEGIFDVGDACIEPPTAVNDYIKRLAEEEETAAEKQRNTRPNGGAQRRRQQRAMVKATALAVPVDRRFTPCGPPFALAVREISESGIRLLNTRATSAEFLALKWSCQSAPFRDVEVVARIIRCDPLSRFYDYGCQFLLAD